MIIKIPVTENQKKTLYFICDFIAKYECPPTTIEIRDALGLSSTGYAHNILVALEKKEYIKRKPWEHRGIRLRRAGQEIFQARHHSN